MATKKPERRGGPRGSRSQLMLGSDGQPKVYKATSDKLPGIEEGALLRVAVEEDKELVVIHYVQGLRANLKGEQYMGLVPRAVRVTPGLFKNNTEETDEEYPEP